MVKLVVKQPGFFIDIHGIGSFRSPIKIKVPDSIRSLAETELLKNGIRDFEFLDDGLSGEKKPIEVKNPKLAEQKGTIDISEVLMRLKDIQLLVGEVLKRDNVIREVVIQKGEMGLVITKQPEIEEEIFIPRISERISVMDLSVKTAEKDNLDSRVELLRNLERIPRNLRGSKNEK